MSTKVKILGIKAEICPSGPCALLIPHEDSEDDLTTQQSLDKMLDRQPWQLLLFAAVQAVEWDLDASHEGKSGPWREIFSAVTNGRRQKRPQVARGFETGWRECVDEGCPKDARCPICEHARKGGFEYRGYGATIEFRRKKPKGKRPCRRRKT